MPTPRKAFEVQKRRQSKTRRANATTAPTPLGKPIKAVPAELETDDVAREKWAAIIDIHSKAGHPLTEGDTEAAARLCLLYSEAAEIRAMLPKAGIHFKDFHKLLDGKRRLMSSLEDRLGLNPVSRMRMFPEEKKGSSMDEETRKELAKWDML